MHSLVPESVLAPVPAIVLAIVLGSVLVNWGRRGFQRTAASGSAPYCSASLRSERGISASPQAVLVSSVPAQAVPCASSSSSAAEPSAEAPSAAASSPDSSSVQA